MTTTIRMRMEIYEIENGLAYNFVGKSSWWGRKPECNLDMGESVTMHAHVVNRVVS